MSMTGWRNKPLDLRFDSNSRKVSDMGREINLSGGEITLPKNTGLPERLGYRWEIVGAAHGRKWRPAEFLDELDGVDFPRLHSGR